jgi:hypothetical protein
MNDPHSMRACVLYVVVGLLAGFVLVAVLCLLGLARLI